MTPGNQDKTWSVWDKFLHDYCMDGVQYMIPVAIIISFSFYFAVGGSLHWYYYVRGRNKPETWKLQAKKFMKKEEQRRQILIGSSNLFLGCIVSGLLAAYVMNGGRLSRLYFNVSDYGWTYLVLSTIVAFLIQDAGGYYLHRIMHLPFFYKHIHKVHHIYTSPTAFAALAVHPIDLLIFQMNGAFPMFVLPLHYLSIIACNVYILYHIMIHHSGVNSESILPWQPPVSFHDDHHRYPNINFGFNTLLFDRLHATLRMKRKPAADKEPNEKTGTNGSNWPFSFRTLRKIVVENCSRVR